MKYCYPLIGVLMFMAAIDLMVTPSQSDTYGQGTPSNILTELNKQPPPYPFSHDGCSLFPDRMFWHDFRAACFRHDVAYWAGGTSLERKYADRRFREDIQQTGLLGTPISYLAYAGVRVFGNSPITKLIDAEWGYGWDD